MVIGLNNVAGSLVNRGGETAAMSARIGLGAGIETIIQAFQFGLAFQPDVLQLPIEKGVDMVIEDVRAIKQKI